MANETKDAFDSMNLSTEQLALALETAKSSDDHQLNDRELSQIEDMLSKLRSMFSESSKVITQPRAERGDIQSQKDLLDQVTNQYQAMNALVSNMTQTLMGLEGVRDKFNQLFGGADGLMANAEKAQQTPGAAQLQLKGVFDQTKNTLDQCTDTFKSQLMEQMALYEAIGAEYYQMQAAMKFIPNTPHTPAPSGDGDGDNPENNNENTENTENNENPENTENNENPENTENNENPDNTETPSDNTDQPQPQDQPGDAMPQEDQQEFVPPPVPSGSAAAAVSENEQQFVPPPVAAAPAGGETQGTAGAAPAGGTVAVPTGGETQGTAVTGGAPIGGAAAAAPSGPEQQGSTAAGTAPMGTATAAPAASEHQTGTTHTAAAQAATQPSAMQQTEQSDRGRKDERQKRSRRKK